MAIGIQWRGADANAGTRGLSHTIIGLSNDTAYIFTLTASNARERILTTERATEDHGKSLKTK